ncbi:MAG: VanZ family protein [Bacteroidales bacterium]|nr:VanZ family protein [Bacteroidales bacterium]
MMKLYFIKQIWIILLVVWTGLLFVFSVIPDTCDMIQQPASNFRLDYLEHLLGYFILGMIFVIWRGDRTFRIQTVELIAFMVIGSIFGWLAEYIQIFVPGRSFNIIDMLYNLLGILSGTGLGYFLLIRVIIRKSIKTS